MHAPKVRGRLGYLGTWSVDIVNYDTHTQSRSVTLSSAYFQDRHAF